MDSESLTAPFAIVESGVNRFQGTKNYIDTSNVVVNEIVGKAEAVRFVTRKSRANMEAEIDDVLFAKMANTRKVLLIDKSNESNIYSTGFFVLRPNQLKVRPKYLYYWTRWENTELLKDRLAHGETQRQLNNTQLKKKFKLPTPKLTAQDDSIERFDRVESLLNRLREQKRIAEQLLRSEREEEFDIEKYASTFESLCKSPTPCRYPTFYGIEYVKVGLPVLKISDMTPDGKLPTDKSLYDCITDEVNARFPNTVVQENDLVLEVRGSYIGKTALVPKELAGSNIRSNNTMRISLDTDQILPEYFWHYTFTSLWQKQIDRITRLWKQGFGTVRADRLKKVKVPAPKKDIQKQVLSRLQAIDFVLTEFSRNISTCEELLQTLLQREFQPSAEG